MKHRIFYLVCLALMAACAAAQAKGVRLKDIARIEGVRDNALTGYGIVIGLSGSGDSSKNRVTVQSVANTLSHFGVNISPDDLSTRNVAAVMVTARLPAFAEPGPRHRPRRPRCAASRGATCGRLLSNRTLLAPLRPP